MSNKPKKLEISPTGGLDLDEKDALDHFLGKDQTEAFKMYASNAIQYESDLNAMGDSAFLYYIEPYLDYMLSDSSDLNADALNALIGTLELKLDFKSKLFEDRQDFWQQKLEKIFSRYDRYEVCEQIYGRLDIKLKRILYAVIRLNRK